MTFRVPARFVLPLVTAAAVLAMHAPARAQTPSEPATAVTPTASAKAAPYSLPWQLRPAAAATVIRSDTAVAMYEDAQGEGGTTVATMLLASYKLTPSLAPLVRLGYVRNSPPAGDAGAALVNPIVGATYFHKVTPDLRLALFLGVALPLGMGGGDDPAPETGAAVRSGILARSAMDNAMFAVNDLVVFPGVDLAFVKDGFTVQLEATVLQLTRVRGEDVQPDASRTNLTSGLHVGWFAAPFLSLGGELRMQRWLSTPKAVEANSALRDTFTFAVGPRFHVALADGIVLRPGIAYARGLDEPMTGAGYQIVQLDVPVSF